MVEGQRFYLMLSIVTRSRLLQQACVCAWMKGSPAGMAWRESWIEIGLPHYVSIDRKPDSGAEFWMMKDCDSRVCLRIEIVPCKEEGDKRKYEKDYPHGTAVTMRMAEPWKGTGRHVFVTTAIVLLSCLGLLHEYGQKCYSSLSEENSFARLHGSCFEDDA